MFIVTFFFTGITAFFVHVSQGRNQTISTNYTLSFVLKTLPTLGTLFAIDGTFAEQNKTYNFSQIVYDAGNSASFSWAPQSGLCLGEFTSFTILDLNVSTQNVSICVRDVLDSPVVANRDLGNVNIGELIPIVLSVEDADDLILDSLGNPSTGSIQTSPFYYIASARFSFWNLTNVQLFSAITPTFCSSDPLVDYLYSHLFNGKELFVFCVLVSQVGSASFSYSMLDSNIADIGLTGVYPYTTSLTFVSTLQSQPLEIVIPTNIPNPTFQLVSFPNFGALKLNDSEIEIGGLFQTITYTPYDQYASYLLPNRQLLEDDSFSFFISTTPFNATSILQHLTIRVFSRPLVGVLEMNPVINLLRGGDASTPVYWLDPNSDVYTIKVNIGLTANIPGSLSIPTSPNVSRSLQSTSTYVSLIGRPFDVNNLLLSTTVFLSDSDFLINGTQHVFVQLFNPFDSPNPVICSSIVLYNTPPAPIAPIVNTAVSTLNTIIETTTGILATALLLITVAVVLQCKQFCNKKQNNIDDNEEELLNPQQNNGPKKPRIRTKINPIGV